MKKIVNCVFLFAMIGISQTAFSSWAWTNAHNINSIDAGLNNLEIDLEITDGAWSDSLRNRSCSVKSVVVIPNSNPMYNTMSSMVLAAYSLGDPITLLVEKSNCEAVKIRISK